MIRSFLVALVIGLTGAGNSLGVADKPDKVRRKDPTPEILKKLQGTWKLVTLVVDGKNRLDDKQGWRVTFTGNRYVIADKSKDFGKSTFTLGRKGGFITMDESYTSLGQKELTYRGILRIDGNNLRICYSLPGKGRPNTFSPPIGSNYYLWVLRRVK